MPFPLSNEEKTNDALGHRSEEKAVEWALDVKCLFLSNFTHRRIKHPTEGVGEIWEQLQRECRV